MEGIAEAEDGKNGCRRAGEPPSRPEWAAAHGSDGALPSIRSAMHMTYFTVSERFASTATGGRALVPVFASFAGCMAKRSRSWALSA